MTLTVGHITYANCAPFFHYLAEAGFSGRIVEGVPAELNRLLAAGAIDASPSSSFEYGCRWQDYLLLPGHSISSCGPVGSVLLFSARPIDALEGNEIALTGESATSVNLLRILLGEFYGFRKVTFRVPDRPVEALIAEGATALLIGDRALRTALGASGHVYDLGELWHRFTGLPFVFALWIVRRQAARTKPEEVAALLRQLASARTRAFASLEAMAAKTPERAWMGEGGLVEYWRRMSYDLDERHLAGLERFFALCVEHGLLPSMPGIRFFG